MSAADAIDDLSASRALGATGLLARLNAEQVLDAADVHVARRAGALTGEDDQDLLLAVALVVRALRAGSTCLDLVGVADELTPYDLPEGLFDGLADRLAASPLAAEPPMLRVEGDLVFLDRYWREEVQVCADLESRFRAPVEDVDQDLLDAGLDRLFPVSGWEEQRAATAIAVAQRTTVLTGGPGTGKTSTVAAVLALLSEQAEAAGHRRPRIALTAPTGKAAARLNESVTGSMAGWEDADRARLGDLQPMTLHRLLGSRRGSSTRFRHHRENRLAHDIVVVDESSMLSLTMMARLLEALRPETRLLLVGDPHQLASIDAGAVLSDLVEGLALRQDLRVAALQTSHRFGPAIGALAEAIRLGDADLALDVLSRDDERLESIAGDDPEGALRERLLDHALALREAALAGDADRALDRLGRHRLLCAHREGARGVNWWNRHVERWIGEATGDPIWDTWYPGRPVLITANDYGLGVFNGDVGVAVVRDGVLRVAVQTTTGVRDFAPSRLSDVQTLHAMTIHKAQGSQAGEVTVLMPDEESRLLTRELFYTAVTRAEQKVTIVGDEAVVRSALERKVRRASGLRERIGTGADV